MSALELKEKGNTFYKNKNYNEALKCYSDAINLDSTDPILYSNRSVVYYNLNQYEKALEDASTCLKLKPDFSRGYLRKGNAEFKLDLVPEAIESYKKGLEYDPTNQALKDALKEAEMPLKDPFTKNYSKLFTDPRTARYMADPTFKAQLDFAMKDQKLLFELFQKDPRFMDVFSVLTGIDLSKMNEDILQQKKEDDQKGAERKKVEEVNRIKAEAERKAREEEERWNRLSEEEKAEEAKKKKAEELKLQGNAEYKQKNFEGALEYYNQAIELNPNEMSFYLNRARANQQLKQYDKTLEDCNYVIENSKSLEKKGTAFGIMGYVHQECNNLEKAIEAFDNSLLEHKDPRIIDAMKEAKKEKKRIDEENYIDPTIAETNNEAANDLYKAGKYPEALKEYNEAIRRNPSNPKYYSNRAACLIKLLEFASASKDCEKAIELDPKFLRAYQRKANCHMMLKEYHKALECYEKALKLFPDDKELKEGYSKVFTLISTSSSKDDEERVQHAYADPEIQKLVKDPRIQQLFKDLQENPKSANDAIMKDEFIAGAFKKLVASGIIKTK